MRSQALLLLALILLAPQVSWAQSGSPVAPDFRAPQAPGICPQIAEDFELCAADLMSGNCENLVSAAGRLGEIYRSELSRHPGWITDLQTSIWWGCGSASFQDLGALLARIGTPQARAVLAREPYASLRRPPAPAPPPAPPAPEEADCLAPPTEAARDTCAAFALDHAKTQHERALSACRARVAQELRGELAQSEASWQQFLPLQCPGTGYTRDECLAQAYQERTQSIFSMHPECGPAPPE